MVDVVLPYRNRKAEVEAKPVELEGGQVVFIDPRGMVALALREFGATLVDVEPTEAEEPELSEAA